VNAFNLVNSFLGGPILGIFLLGMLTYRAKGNATIVGAATGMISVALISWKLNVSFFYYSLIGVAVTFAVGYLLSLPGATRAQSELKDLVYRFGDVRNK
jgi:Na+/proline symporter